MYDLAEKAVVITGASSGIGRAAALGLAARGARTILLGRSSERLKDVAVQTDGVAVRCDFETFESTRAAAAQISEITPQIDVLVSNAGAFHREHRLTVDGNERTLQVNALAPFLFTRLLAPLLTRAARPRVVFTSSELHRAGTPRLPDPNSPEHFDGREFHQGTYADTKLFSAALTYGFAKRWTDIEFANFHPGTVHTAMSRNMPILALVQKTPLRRLFTITAADAASSLVEVLIRDESYRDGACGATYFDRSRPATAADAALDDTLIERFWSAATDLTGESITS